VRVEEVSRFQSPDLAYVVELEVADVRLSGRAELERSTLRVTMIFRREGDS
jgi:ketosteroid isomerase-like protein